MSDYKKYKESHLKTQKKYDDKNRNKKHEYDKKRWEQTKLNKKIIEQLKDYVLENYKSTYLRSKGDTNVKD